MAIVKDQQNGFATVYENGKPMGAIHYGRRGIEAVKDEHAVQVMQQAQKEGEFVIIWIEKEKSLAPPRRPRWRQ